MDHRLETIVAGYQYLATMKLMKLLRDSIQLLRCCEASRRIHMQAARVIR